MISAFPIYSTLFLSVSFSLYLFLWFDYTENTLHYQGRRRFMDKNLDLLLFFLFQ